MLVEQPHSLGRIDGGAAAQGDDDVRLEGAHGLHAPHDGFHVRIRLHVGINLAVAILLPLAEIIKDLIHIAQLYHGGIGDDESAGDILHFFQILNGIVFKINLRGDLEPLHVDPPLSQALFVNQVDGGHVGVGGIVSVAAAAQGQGGGVGVVDVADSALGGGGVGNHPADMHNLAVMTDQIVIGGVDDRRMAQAAHFQHLSGALEALLMGIHHIIGENGGELFPGEGILRSHGRQPGDEDLGILRNGKAGLRRDPYRLFAHHIRVHGLLGRVDYIIRQFFAFLFVDEITAVILHVFLEGGGDFLIHDHRLLGGADHAVVKGLGKHEIGAGPLQLGGFLDVAGHVAGTDAQGGLAAAISRLDHAGASGGQDQRHAGVVHQRLGGGDGGSVDPLDAVFRSAGGHRGLQQHFSRFHRAFLRAGMEAEDNGIAGLGADQGFEHGGGGGIGDGRHAGDDAHRLRHLHIPFHFVFLDDAHAFLIFDGMPDIFGGEQVFDDFVLINAPPGFLIGQLGQTDVMVVARRGRSCPPAPGPSSCIRLEPSARWRPACRSSSERRFPRS